MQFRVIPIAGWKQTLDFVIHAQNMLFNNSCVRAVLDTDVFNRTPDDTVDGYNRKQKTLDAYRHLAYDLGVTPEVGIISALEKKNPDITQKIKDTFHADVSAFLQSDEYISHHAKNPRDEAKKKLRLLLSFLSSRSALSEDMVLSQLVPMLIPVMYTPERLSQIAGRILSAKK